MHVLVTLVCHVRWCQAFIAFCNFTLKPLESLETKAVSVKYRLWTADCRLGVKFRLSENTDCRLRVKHIKLGAKCRSSINCMIVVERFTGQKIPQIHVNDHLLDICFHKSITSFSGTSSTAQNNCNL